MSLFGLLGEIVKTISLALDIAGLAQLNQILNDEDLDFETRKQLERLIKELED